MKHLNEKHIWDEVIGGDVHNAVEWTRSYRNALHTPGRIAARTSKPVALYLEPSLHSKTGHQQTLATCYKQLFDQQDFTTRVVCSLWNSLSARENWFPHFLVKHHTMASENINSLATLKRVQSYFFYEFDELFRMHHPHACVFATIRFTNIIAAAQALVKNDVRLAVFGVMEATEVPDCEDSGIVQSAFKSAAGILEEHELLYLIIAETETVKTFLLGCGFPKSKVRVYPYVGASQIDNFSSPAVGKPDKVQVGYVGGSRPARHPELIADLVVSGALPESVELRVQLDLRYIQSTLGQNVYDEVKAKQNSGQFRLYPPNLSNQEYRSLFCSLDFVIMPYSQRYEQIGSGVFLEAIYAGVIPILPTASKLSEMYTTLGGAAPGIQTLSSTAIEKAIIEGVSRYKELSKQVMDIRKAWVQSPYSAEKWRLDLVNWLHQKPVDHQESH